MIELGPLYNGGKREPSQPRSPNSCAARYSLDAETTRLANQAMLDEQPLPLRGS